MERSNKQLANLDHVSDTVFFIDHTEFTVDDFFTQLVEGAKVEDCCELTYKDKSFDIKRVYPRGVTLGRDICLYRLVEIIKPNTQQK